MFGKFYIYDFVTVLRRAWRVEVCYQSTADYLKQPANIESAYKKSAHAQRHAYLCTVLLPSHSHTVTHTHTHSEGLINISQRERRSTRMEFGHFIWAWWEKGRAWADWERDGDVMSCEGGIPHTKNNRLQSDIYCAVGFTVYVGPALMWHSG